MILSEYFKLNMSSKVKVWYLADTFIQSNSHMHLAVAGDQAQVNRFQGNSANHCTAIK